MLEEVDYVAEEYFMPFFLIKNDMEIIGVNDKELAKGTDQNKRSKTTSTTSYADTSQQTTNDIVPMNTATVADI